MVNSPRVTLSELEQLIAESKGEWEQIEFKKTTGELHGGMESLCGFLNGSGGKVLFGVNNAGKILGQETGGSTFYPYLALREALVNAICHRDYSIVGGAVHVAIFDDRVEIISSGLLPAGITIDDLKRDHVSLPRNPTISEVFFRCGLIEKWGRGTQKIVELCLDGGYPEPRFSEQAGNFTVLFPSGSYVPPTRIGHNLTERQRKILKILSGRKEWVFPEFYKLLDDSISDRAVRSELRLLNQLGIVGSRGRGKNARWWLIVPDG